MDFRPVLAEPSLIKVTARNLTWGQEQQSPPLPAAVRAVNSCAGSKLFASRLAPGAASMGENQNSQDGGGRFRWGGVCRSGAGAAVLEGGVVILEGVTSVLIDKEGGRK